MFFSTVTEAAAWLHSNTAPSGGHCQWLLADGGWLGGQGHSTIHGCAKRTGNFDEMRFHHFWIFARVSSQYGWAFWHMFTEILTCVHWVFDLHSCPTLLIEFFDLCSILHLSNSLRYENGVVRVSSWLVEKWMQHYITLLTSLLTVVIWETIGRLKWILFSTSLCLIYVLDVFIQRYVAGTCALCVNVLSVCVSGVCVVCVCYGWMCCWCVLPVKVLSVCAMGECIVGVWYWWMCCRCVLCVDVLLVCVMGECVVGVCYGWMCCWCMLWVDALWAGCGIVPPGGAADTAWGCQCWDSQHINTPTRCHLLHYSPAHSGRCHTHKSTLLPGVTC